MSQVKFIDGFNYANLLAPEAQADGKYKLGIEEILNKYGFNNKLNEELIEDFELFINTEVKDITLEFVARFFERLGKGSKLAYSVARALGFHVYLKDKDGNEVTSLKEIAEYWNVCPQLIDQLSKQIQKDLNFDPIDNLSIHKKKYDYKVKAPDGYMTTGQVLEFLNISNKKLNGIVKFLDIKKKSYCRGSKLLAEADIDRIELYLMEGK